jgi:hypothetical protein
MGRWDDERVRQLESAARRSTTITEVAALMGIVGKSAAEALQRYAPEALRQLRRAPGIAMSNTAGNAVKHAQNLREDGLPMPAQGTLSAERAWDNLVEDYGVDEVARWLDGYNADHYALLRIRWHLRKALQRAGYPVATYHEGDHQ